MNLGTFHDFHSYFLGMQLNTYVNDWCLNIFSGRRGSLRKYFR